MTNKKELLRNLPSVDELLRAPEIETLLEAYPRSVVVDVTRSEIERLRADIVRSTDAVAEEAAIDMPQLLTRIGTGVKTRVRPSLKRVINATGVVLHTNLGRSILAEAAVTAVIDAASHYSNLEYDIDHNIRGSRHAHVERLLTELTGAEAGMVVNNNASAVLLALSAVAKGKEVIVSRGQLVEIGGSFRIPDVMRASGAKLVEVGTTNKTYLTDYKNAVTPKTALLMRVHPSNFRVVGFSAEATLPELVALGLETGLPVLDDLGSGVIIDLESYGIAGEPTVKENVQTGADIVTFSGDKLLGGPQAGLIVGNSDYIKKLKKHPLARAIRVDKMTLAALEATLSLYREPARALQAIPTLSMLTAKPADLRPRAERLAHAISSLAGNHLRANVAEDVSKAGGGSLPLLDLETVVVALQPLTMTANQLEERLRLRDPAILARIKEDRLLLDVRTILEDEPALIVQAIDDIAHSL